MPVLKSSSSDFTSFVRAQAVLPYNGKARGATVTTVNAKIAAVVATTSTISASAAPKTTLYVGPSIKSNGNRKGD